MHKFKEYTNLMEKLIRVSGDFAYWQHPLYESVKIGTMIEPINNHRFVGIENIFESLRPKEYPSRINSIIVSSHPDNIRFNNNSPIYKVKISGDAFHADLRKFNEAIHSNDSESIREWATKYWSGMSSIEEKHIEIILCGEVTIIEEIKNEII
jgi:hypothetical protein